MLDDKKKAGGQASRPGRQQQALQADAGKEKDNAWTGAPHGAPRGGLWCSEN